MLEDNHYFILFKNIIFSRITFYPEIDYALKIMIENENYNKKLLWIISSLGIEISNIINYSFGCFIYYFFIHFKKIKNATYIFMKQKISKLILALLLFSSYSNGGGIIVLIAGFFRIQFKKVIIITICVNILTVYIKIFF